MRRLMHYGQMFQSHALHFFHLCSPDLLFGFDADPAIRNIIGVAAEYPELAKQGILMRKYGQEVIKATAGKKVHGTGAIPGGINKNLSMAERDDLARRPRPDDRVVPRRAEDRQGLHGRASRDGQGLWLLRVEPSVDHPRRRCDGPVRRRLAGDRRGRQERSSIMSTTGSTSTTSPRKFATGRT